MGTEVVGRLPPSHAPAYVSVLRTAPRVPRVFFALYNKFKYEIFFAGVTHAGQICVHERIHVICMNYCYIVISVRCISEYVVQPWVSKRSRVPVPIELLAIVIGTLVSRFWGLKEVFGIKLVGTIPTG
jgi:hypothetical protein